METQRPILNAQACMLLLFFGAIAAAFIASAPKYFRRLLAIITILVVGFFGLMEWLIHS
jgi:hypothetical protein